MDDGFKTLTGDLSGRGEQAKPASPAVANSDGAVVIGTAPLPFVAAWTKVTSLRYHEKSDRKWSLAREL